VVVCKDVLPGSIAEDGRALGRGNDVREHHGRQDSLELCLRRTPIAGSGGSSSRYLPPRQVIAAGKLDVPPLRDVVDKKAVPRRSKCPDRLSRGVRQELLTRLQDLGDVVFLSNDESGPFPDEPAAGSKIQGSP